MRVAAIQFAYDNDEGVQARLQRALSVVAQQRGADLVVLPELWSVGAYRTSAWTARAETLAGPTVTALAQVASQIGAVVHAGSIIERDESGALHNTAVLLGPDGSLLATYRKIHRFAAGGREGELLEPGTEVAMIHLPLRDGSSIRTGLSTCYDLRFPELYRLQVQRGAELFIVPASWPTPRADAWEVLMRARALENQCALIGVNAAGVDGKTAMAGRSAIIDAWGRPLAELGQAEDVLDYELNIGDVHQAREALPVLRDRVL
ncbi:nitrilase-related carbon-nitrogen hydrolase [Gephyromycinifex aptenodytis]|uniref:nitrilase-related carbon-nitrogen hydrolase n=1 Tax=Gephyromycinifex aptenodytis TaxID=2716227 RepID=UPI001447A0A9|nr:nitrilase-related carbon-nitrogen hydrolase [Gephyromycinifex aptenodytis]